MLKEKGSFFAVLDTHNLVVKQVETCILGSILLRKDQNAYYQPFQSHHVIMPILIKPLFFVQIRVREII